MADMGEHAIAIARVSSLAQDEEDQRPGLVAYSDRKGYVLDEVVAVHGRSAFHGRHVKAILAAVEKHVKNGSARVVIFRHVDRSSREGVFKGFALLNRIMEAGARIEFSEQEFLNDNPGFIGPMFEVAKKESEVKRDRANQGIVKRRAAGQLVGRIPWGYDPVTIHDRKHNKTVQIGMKPGALGLKWIPVIFAECAAGKSARALADMLRGVPSPQKNGLWSEQTILRIIANTTYYGRMAGNPFLEYDPIVSVELWHAANAAVAARTTNGRSTTKNAPVFVRPYCAVCWGKKREGSPSGKSPMYRKPFSENRGKEDRYYCRGHGPARGTCGAQGISVSELDAAIDETMGKDNRPYMVHKYVAGDDNAEKRSVINEKIKAAQEASDYMLVAQLAQEAMEIGPSDRKGKLALRYSGKSIGQHWQTLTPAEKRDELATWTVIAGTNDEGKLYAVLDKPSPDGMGALLVIGDLPGKSLLARGREDPESVA